MCVRVPILTLSGRYRPIPPVLGTITARPVIDHAPYRYIIRVGGSGDIRNNVKKFVECKKSTRTNVML